MLEAFFGKESRFFLSGGGALAGFHLGHRETDDLDLFTTEDVLDQGATALGAVARGLPLLAVVADDQTLAAPAGAIPEEPAQAPSAAKRMKF